MPSEATFAPTFTATPARSDHEPFDPRNHLGDGPAVLAFFAGAFTPPCTTEMVTVEEHREELAAAGTT